MGTKMKVKFKPNFFYFSVLCSLLLAYVIPCRHIDDFKKIFGFPLGWFTIFNNTIGDVIISSTSLNLLSFFVNSAIIYFIFIGFYKLYCAFTHKDPNK